MSKISIGERWRNDRLQQEGEVTGMFIVQMEIAGEQVSRWCVQIAYDLSGLIDKKGATGCMRYTETLFLDTHQKIKDAVHT